MATVIEESPMIELSETTPQPIQPPIVLTQVEGQPYLFTVEQFRQMVAKEVLTKSDKVELLEGCVIRKMTVNTSHRFVLQMLTRWLTPPVPEQKSLFSQSPIRLQTSAPEPDLAICEGPFSLYRISDPSPGDVLVAIEISDSSLRLDRLVKRRIYAQAGIPIYWIVNIPDRVIEIYTDPDPTASEPIYRMMRTIRESEMVALVLDGTEVGQILVKDLLP